MSETLLSGELGVDDGRRRTLGPGDAVFLGRGTRHSFANESDAPLVAYFFCTPGSLERFFRDVGSAATEHDVAAAAPA